MDPSLTEALQFDQHQLRTRLAFFRIGEEDLARLAALRPMMEASTAQIVALFYDHLNSQPETRDFLDDPALVDRLKAKQTAYFLQLFDGRIDLAYVENRFRVGAAHERLGVPPRWYIGAFDRYLELVRERLVDRGVSGAELVADLAAVERIMHFDAALAIDAYVAGHLATHARHQAALRELASPVIRIHDRVLLLPLVGTIDSFRAQQVMESALLGVSEEQARVLILDIAGVAVVDTQVADHLLKTTAAVRLLGARTILTGISPQVARTIVELGVDLKTLHTRNKLSDGLELALSILGRGITDVESSS
ncbi:MAG: STAS domain-containing protein [Myxococcales bacterium]|nr:STAS domain-containing protein [Myxococcales bacterium]